MEMAQVAQQAAAASILGTGLLLGLRHGIDWDHIAAITDIASTTTTVGVAETTQQPQLSRVGRRSAILKSAPCGCRCSTHSNMQP